MHSIRTKIVKLGKIKTVVLLTIISIIASATISFSIWFFSGSDILFLNMMVAVVVPAIIAPALTWYIVSLLINIHYLESKMRELATYDMLTGAMTRQAFLEAYENTYYYSLRNNLPLAFIYIDLDDFKKINDAYGHAGGDEALTSLSDIIKEHKRKSDIFGRMGGEEFVLVLPDTDLEGAILLANKLRCLARRAKAKYYQHDIQYTVSIGVAVYEQCNQVNLEQLIRQADHALYCAKHLGKDRVVEFTIVDS